MENINEQALENLGIFELRNLAREVGVHSPTTLKKTVLIEKVMRIVNGQDEPCKLSKQGRPPKSLNSMSDLMNVLIPKKLYENKVEKQNQAYAVFNDNETNYASNELGTNEFTFSGYIKTQDDGSYSLCYKDCFTDEVNQVIFINKIQTDFYHLKTGDFVTGKYYKLEGDKPMILKEIYSINENPFAVSMQSTESFFEQKALVPVEKIRLKMYKVDDQIFDDIDLFTPLAKGQRILLKSKNNTSFNYKLLHRISTGENNLKGLAILIDELPENYYEISSNQNFLIIRNNYNKENSFDLELEVKLNHIFRLAENGNNVVLFINDLEKFANFLSQKNILMRKSTEESQILAGDELKNLILLGRNLEKGSITLIAGTNFANNTYDNLFNNVIYYDSVCCDFMLNKEKSFTFNIDKILSKSEIAKLKAILSKK